MRLRKKSCVSLLIAGALFGLNHFANAQNSIVLSGQDQNGRRVITTAVPFLNFAPDSRHSAMGDVGVATSADANSAHWNAGKLAFNEQPMAIALSYSPWLGRLVNDMSVSYLAGYKKIDENSAFGFDLRFFNMGDVELTDEMGNELGEFNPRDIAIGGTYSRKLSEKFGLGISARFIHSNLSGNLSSAAGNEARPGTSVGADIGVYYRNAYTTEAGKDRVFSWGATITNIGPRITYNSAEDLDYIPTNLRIGAAYQIFLDPDNSLTFALDLNKLMVPTPPVFERNEDNTIVTDANGNPIIAAGRDPNRPLLNGMFTSFIDAPDGFVEELQEITISTGVEYLYKNTFAVRAGYFYENPRKGGRRFFTMGVGFNYQRLGFDFSYLVPQTQNHPLAETLRLTLGYRFN